MTVTAFKSDQCFGLITVAEG